MTFETREQILEAIRDAGRRGARVEFMKIVSEHPIDFATATEAFNEGQNATAGAPATLEDAE